MKRVLSFDGEGLRALLSGRGISVGALEETLRSAGASVNVRDWTNKGLVPSSRSLFILSQALGVPMESLLVTEEVSGADIRICEGGSK